MKKRYLLLIFLFSNTACLFGQNHLVCQTVWNQNAFDSADPETKTYFEYDALGNEILTTIDLWQDSFRTFAPLFEVIKTYNESNQITSEAHQFIYGGNITKQLKIEFFYSGTCLEAQHYYNYSQFGISNESISYYNTSSCKIDSMEYYAYANASSEIKLVYVERNTYDGNKDTRLKYFYDDDGIIEETPRYKREIITNDKGLIISDLNVSLFISGDHGSLYLFEYDQYDNQTSYTRYAITEFGTTLTSERTTEYEYNEAGQVLQSTIRRQFFPGSPSLFEHYLYEYHCDGLLKKETHTSFTRGSVRETDYQYERGHDCEIQEQENLLTVRPNFTRGNVIIESELLEAENSKIAIYDMSGRRLKYVDASGRFATYFLDLSDLPLGNYIIHVFTNNKSAARRVLKVN